MSNAGKNNISRRIVQVAIQTSEEKSEFLQTHLFRFLHLNRRKLDLISTNASEKLAVTEIFGKMIEIKLVYLRCTTQNIETRGISNRWEHWVNHYALVPGLVRAVKWNCRRRGGLLLLRLSVVRKINKNRRRSKPKVREQTESRCRNISLVNVPVSIYPALTIGHLWEFFDGIDHILMINSIKALVNPFLVVTFFNGNFRNNYPDPQNAN